MKSIFVDVFFYEYIILFLCEFVYCKITYVTYPKIVTRATTFSPKIARKSCLLKPDEGPCRADITMYHFDPATLNCTRFEWGGCQGNGNRFDTRADCLDFCLSKPDQKSKRPKWCNLSFDYGFCFGAIERYYYDRLWKVCKKTIYSGCGGNKNNFYNMEQCQSVCQYGIGPIIETTTSRYGKNKVLIINPWDATSKRGRNQTAATTVGTPPAKNNSTAAG